MKNTNYNFQLSRINRELIIRLLCAVAFCIFSFLYLYSYQADVLAYAQHILSGGKTHYNALAGAFLITTVLLIFQILLSLVAKPKGCLHALTYIPSLAIIAYISDISVCVDKTFMGFASVFIISISLSCLIIYLLKKIPKKASDEETKDSFFFRQLWINALTITFLFFVVGLKGNGDAVFHKRLKLERLISNGNYDKAFDVVNQQSESNDSCLMLTACAMSNKNMLGEKFFENISSGSSSMLLNMNGNSLLMLPPDFIYKYLGVIPAKNMNVISYLQYAERHKKWKKAVYDYLLTAYMLDKKLDAFCHVLRSHYKIDENLPKHYREALILYAHLRVHPAIVLTDDVMEADFEDFFTALRKKSPTDRAELFKSYGNTYWYYYYK